LLYKILYLIVVLFYD
jgi:regulator-associated protein of mTOR